MASCSLQNVFLEVWNLVKMNYFCSWIIGVDSRELKQIVYLLKGGLNSGDLKISLITVNHMASCSF